jgi:hypothetical protein
MKHSRFSLLAAVALVAATAAPAVAPKTVRDGIEAWQRADYATAVAIWRPLAEKGDADAAFNLGQAYRLGRGVAIDLAAAQTWLRRAANAGHLDAETTLGLLLFDSGSRDEALQWLKKAADRGEPRAMLVYGTALFNGDGVTRDPVLAYAYVSRSAAQGLEPAKTTLKDMDGILPLDIRQKGIALAMSKAKEKPAPSSKPAAKPAAKPATEAAAKPQVQAPSKPSTQVATKAAPPSAAPTPAAPAKASGSWRIQLGAFSQRGSAEALYKKLSGSLGGRQAFYIPVGTITRLQVGPFESKAAAESACKAARVPCFPVPGK